MHRVVLRTSEIKSAKGKQLDAFIAAKNVTRTVTITGTHSPEGTERKNSKLANERAAAIEKFYRAQMKKYDYQAKADEIKFIQKPIVDGGTDFESTEKQLQKLAGYKKVLKEVYPGLRTAKTEILTLKAKKTDAEMSV